MGEVLEEVRLVLIIPNEHARDEAQLFFECAGLRVVASVGELNPHFSS